MMWSLFIAVVSLGHFPETFARSLVPSVVMVPLVAFRLNQNHEWELTHDSAVYFVSRFCMLQFWTKNFLNPLHFYLKILLHVIKKEI